LCWFEAGITDSYGPLRALHDGLGLLPGSNCPHYDSEPGRRPTFQRAVADGLPAGIAADDCCGLHFAGTELADVVTSRPEARAYRVEQGPDGVRETPIAARFLGA
jgi:peptidase E